MQVLLGEETAAPESHLPAVRAEIDWTVGLIDDDSTAREELEGTIAEVARDSEPTLETYTERVLDRLGYVPHEANADLYVPPDRPYAVDSNAPAIDRKRYADLTREEKVHGLRVALARRAADRARSQLSVADAREEVFDGTLSESLYCRL